MRKHLGWIALDIDGTITDETHYAPPQVVQYLHQLEKKGWTFMFITGRTFSYAYQVVKEFDFPFYLAVQNGADVLCMPQKEMVVRRYLEKAAIPFLEKAYQTEQEDFILYSGYEKGDFCYYRPDRFSPALTEHIHRLMALSPEPWKSVKNFNFKGQDNFPLAYCLGTKEGMQRVDALLQTFPDLSSTMIRDPFNPSVYLVLVTAKEATKGNALNTIIETIGEGGPVIAAGDDLNDVSMLREADVKIVMSSAPKEMHEMATVLGRHSPSQHGIIDALAKAIKTAH